MQCSKLNVNITYGYGKYFKIFCDLIFILQTIHHVGSYYDDCTINVWFGQNQLISYEIKQRKYINSIFQNKLFFQIWSSLFQQQFGFLFNHHNFPIILSGSENQLKNQYSLYA